MRLDRRTVAEARAALPAWLAARVLVVVAWFASRWWIDARRNGVRPDASVFGLFGWDGVFYRGIAAHGYRFEAREALRFLPLYPLLGRFVDTVTHVGVATALVVIANASAFVAAMLVHRLTRMESSSAAAGRAARYLALVPPAFVLCWGFAEATFIALAAWTFLGLRRERWWWAALGGFLAALTRPTGVFLALAALVEAARGARALPVRTLAPRLGAVVAPVLGTGAYLWWVGREYGDWQTPLRIQRDLRGHVVNPMIRLGQASSDLVHLDKHGLHFPFAVAMVVLAVVAFRRLPASYGAFATAIVVVALAAENLNSTERYALNAFPLVMALAIVVQTRVADRVTTAVCAAGFFGLCTLAWLGTYVP